MALTRSFKQTVQARVREDAAFRAELLSKGVEALLNGELDIGKTILRDYINATVGFDRLGRATDVPPKSLMRMFSPSGNPNARNLFSVISYLQHSSGISLHVHPQH